MAISTYSYTSNSGDVWRVRLDDDTAAAGSFSGTTGIDANTPRAKVSKNNGEAGLRPRGVRLSRVAQATVSRFLPVATESAVDALVSAGTVTVGGESWTVTSAVAEDL